MLTVLEHFKLISALSLWGTLFFCRVSTACSTSVMVSGRGCWVALQCNSLLLVLFLSWCQPHLLKLDFRL